MVTFDVATSLFRSGTNHDHDQPPHLHIKSTGAAVSVNKGIFNGPETRYCPAGALFLFSSLVCAAAMRHMSVTSLENLAGCERR